jgi:hypothetical protein
MRVPEERFRDSLRSRVRKRRRRWGRVANRLSGSSKQPDRSRLVMDGAPASAALMPTSVTTMHFRRIRVLPVPRAKAHVTVQETAIVSAADLECKNSSRLRVRLGNLTT